MKLRLATLDDISETFRWRNHPEVRRYFVNPMELAFEEHERWFRAKIVDKTAVMLIAEIEEKPMGVLRFDFAGAHEVVVDVYLNPEFFGLGKGTQLLQEGVAWLRIHRTDVKKIRAQVLADNTASNRVFAKAGFSHWLSEYVYNLGT